MNLSLTKQSALEISQFLSDKASPPSKYPDVASSRAAVRVRHSLEQSIKDYSAVFAVLVKKDQDALKAAQAKLKKWEDGFAAKDKAPSAEAKAEFVKKLQEKFEIERKVFQDKAKEHEENHGSTKIAVELTGKYPEKDWEAVQAFFEKEGNKFPMWNIGDKLEEIAQVFDKNKVCDKKPVKV